MLQELKKVIPYKWRVQSINEYNATCVAYIDSRQVQDLLDEVVGAESWQSDYKEVKGNMFAGIGIKQGNEWIWKWDCGTESKTDAEKGEASDSFKRSAVKWGIGRFLYSLDIQRLKVAEYKNKKYPADNKGKVLFSGNELTDYINSITAKKVIVEEVKEGKKEITDMQMVKLIARYNGGETDVFSKAEEHYSFREKDILIINEVKNYKK
jgi:hypothetical protein